ncbi:conserved hypothetical protein [Roseibium sp. TrichSKD4]|uniref:hypothetical protein n=1 Tax=Roseibium sp. TrichSKD4 TaxID=744980 RepID=UPI0001E56244|nr:hypothetical protein [Roseibium sp. TrichSKD4]EFO33803.1 conserved hypothetical protein [Roseibium sp. TrichSKD4]
MTTETKWTAGPWGVGDFDAYLFGGDCISDGLTVGPAQLDAADYGAALGFRASGNVRALMRADAYLISAAPELYDFGYAALNEVKAVLADLTEHGDGVDFVRKDIRRLSKIVSDGETALSKARGEAQ